jgi:hypothetical protein
VRYYVWYRLYWPFGLDTCTGAVVPPVLLNPRFECDSVSSAGRLQAQQKVIIKYNVLAADGSNVYMLNAQVVGGILRGRSLQV